MHFSRFIFGRLVFCEVSRDLWYVTDRQGYKNTYVLAYAITENPEGLKLHRLIAWGLCVGWSSPA